VEVTEHAFDQKSSYQTPSYGWMKLTSSILDYKNE